MATDWGALIREWGPVALEAYSAYSGNKASNDATDAQLGALDQAGRLQYQTALQAMELARQRDMQTRLDTEQSRFGGYTAMNQIARQLGLPVYNQPFNRTLDTFNPSAGGVGSGVGTGVGGSGGRVGGVNPTGVTPNGAPGAGAAVGSVIGGAFGGPAGSAAGSFIGGGIERNGYDWKQLEVLNGGNLFTDKHGNKLMNAIVEPSLRNMAALVGLAGEGGDLATGSRVFASKSGDKAVFFDQAGNVIWRGAVPTSGQTQIPGLSRNGNPIFLTSEGKVVKQQQSGGGFDDLGFNINDTRDGPAEVNKIIAKGYNPLPPTPQDYGQAPAAATGTGISIPGGETANTGLIQEPTTLDRYAGFKETPGYQFVLDEGLRARDKMAASRGRYFSGGTGRELERYAQGVASQEYDNYFRRLQDQVTGGNSAIGVTANSGAQQTGSAINSLLGGASDLGNAILGSGQVRASGITTNNQNTNAAISGIAGSGIFDRLGSIFGSSSGVTKSRTPSSSGAKSPLSAYNNHGYTLDNLRAYGA